MPNAATTVEQYLAALPADRRQALEAVRAVFRANLTGGYEEGMQYGMIGYYVPHAVYPDGYHCDPSQPLPFAGLASRKGHMSLHLMGLYLDPAQRARFEEEWARTGRKLDMGKACVRFKRLDDLPLEVLGRAIARMPARVYIAQYEAILGSQTTRRPRAAKPDEAASPRPTRATPARASTASGSARPAKGTGPTGRARKTGRAGAPGAGTRSSGGPGRPGARPGARRSRRRP